jgi:N-acetylated-alpha-linked acidic dipeptidase
MDISLYAGDPLTPGYPAYKASERQNATNIPTIPCIPISWHNAQRLLGEIGDIYERNGSRIALSGSTSETLIQFVNQGKSLVKITTIESI